MKIETIKEYIISKELNSGLICDTWSFSFTEDDNKLNVTFSMHTKHGREYCIECEFNNKTTKNDISETLQDYYESFDISEETYIYLDNTGHGKNGAPYDLRSVLEDTEEIASSIESLIMEFSK